MLDQPSPLSTILRTKSFAYRNFDDHDYQRFSKAQEERTREVNQRHWIMTQRRANAKASQSSNGNQLNYFEVELGSTTISKGLRRDYLCFELIEQDLAKVAKLSSILAAKKLNKNDRLYSRSSYNLFINNFLFFFLSRCDLRSCSLFAIINHYFLHDTQSWRERLRQFDCIQELACNPSFSHYLCRRRIRRRYRII